MKKLVWTCASCKKADCAHEDSETCAVHLMATYSVRTREVEQELTDLKARGIVPDANCTCGSGLHPRVCAKHPHRYEMHCQELDLETKLAEAQERLAQLLVERDEARSFATMHEAAHDEYKDAFVYWKKLAEEREGTVLALRNVRALAMRLHRTDPENAQHLLRFCAEGGVVARILREDAEGGA